MRDRELYATILGITAPWTVTDVNVALDAKEVRVLLATKPKKRMMCPKCGKPRPGYDSSPPRSWRHLDTCQLKTILTARIPRVNCPKHGVLQIKVPWAEDKSRFTALFEALVISWLHEANITAVAYQLALSWEQVDGVMQRAVQRGLERRGAKLPTCIGVDEKAFRRGQDYATIVSDQDTGHVVHVAKDRKKDSLDQFYRQFDESERATVASVSMDMWPAYISSTQEYIPDADRKIAFDKFHIAKHLGEAVDQVRRTENKKLRQNDNDILVGTKYLWLTNPDHMSERKWLDFAGLRKSQLKTARAWALKETAMSLWDYKSRAWAEKAWKKWYSWAIRSRLDPIKKVARMVKRHWDGVITAVVTKVSNAQAEGINSVIQWLKSSARGFRNWERYRNAIYFHLGGLELYPSAISG